MPLNPIAELSGVKPDIEDKIQKGVVKIQSYFDSDAFTRMQSNPAGAIAPGAEYRFSLVNNHDYDFSAFYLVFNGLVASEATGQAILPDGVGQLIESIRLEVDGIEIDRIDNYPEKINIDACLKPPAVVPWRSIMGFGSIAQRIARNSGGARTYVWPLSLLEGVEIFPRLSLFKARNVELVIVMANATASLEAPVAATTPTYTATSLELYMKPVIASPALLAYWQSTRKIHFRGYSRHTSTVNNASTNVQVQIPGKGGSVRRAYTVLQPTATINTITTMSRRADFQHQTLTTYQHFANGKPYPTVPVRAGLTTASEAVLKLIHDVKGGITWPPHAHQMINIDEDLFTRTGTTEGKCIITACFLPDPANEDAISGMSFKENNSSFYLELNFTTTTAECRATTFLEHDKVVMIGEDNVVRVLQ